MSIRCLFLQLLSEIRQPLVEVFSSFFRYSESSSSSVVDVLSSAAAVVVTDVVNFVHCREVIESSHRFVVCSINKLVIFSILTVTHQVFIVIMRI